MPSFYDVILWSIRLCPKENCRCFVLYNNMEKVQAELALLSVEKVCVLHLTSFYVCTLTDDRYEPISAQKF